MAMLNNQRVYLLGLCSFTSKKHIWKLRGTSSCRQRQGFFDATLQGIWAFFSIENQRCWSSLSNQKLKCWNPGFVPGSTQMKRFFFMVVSHVKLIVYLFLAEDPHGTHPFFISKSKFLWVKSSSFRRIFFPRNPHDLVGGDWNIWYIFFHSVGNGIIPTDFNSIIFQRGGLKPPTKILLGEIPKHRGPVVVLCPAGTAATGGPFLKTLVVDDHSMAMQRLNRLIGGTDSIFLRPIGRRRRPMFQGISPENMVLYGTVPPF